MWSGYFVNVLNIIYTLTALASSVLRVVGEELRNSVTNSPLEVDREEVLLCVGVGGCGLVFMCS